MTQKNQHLGLCWGSVEEHGLLALAENASRAGLEFISIAPRQYAELRSQNVSDAELRARLADLGIRVCVIDPLVAPLPGVPDRADVAADVRWFFEASIEDCWRAGEAVGAAGINMSPYLGRSVPDDEFRDGIAQIAELNRAHGMTSTLEFVPTSSIRDLCSAARVTRGIDALSVMFDTWHFARSGGTVEQILALEPDSIGGVQISDWLPPVEGETYVPMSGRLMPGDGCLPLREILVAIDDNSPGLDVGIEVFNSAIAKRGRAAVVEMVERSIPLLANRCRSHLADAS